MPQTATLHVKIEPAVAGQLKRISHRHGVTMGELVRRAISSCYQTEMIELAENARRAVEAYRGGYISLGKLAEEMGLPVLEARTWLADHGIEANSEFAAADIRNA